MDRVYIFNYGFEISDDLKQRTYKNVHLKRDFPTSADTTASNDNNLIQFIEMGDDSSLFEVPTLLALQTFVHKTNTIRIKDTAYPHPQKDMQILYLHTKGVSYTQRYQQIDDWRNMMLYFLVEEHVSCYHALSSGEYDVLGLNRNPDKSFAVLSGNFWWVSSKRELSSPISMN